MCTQRNSDTESGVPPGVFARLACYADRTHSQLLDSTNKDTVVCKLRTDELTPVEVCDKFITLVAKEVDALRAADQAGLDSLIQTGAIQWPVGVGMPIACTQ